MVEVDPQVSPRQHVEQRAAGRPAEAVEEELRPGEVAVEHIVAHVVPAEQHHRRDQPERRDGGRTGEPVAWRAGGGAEPGDGDPGDDDDGDEQRRAARPGACRRGGTEHDQVTALPPTGRRADAADTGPHHGGRRGEPEPIVHRLGEQRVTLRDEGGDRGRGHSDAAPPATQVARQQIREDNSCGGEGDVCQAHQHQPAVRSIE